MKILSLECSAGPASAAVVEDKEVRASLFLNCGLTHSVTLVPAVSHVLEMSRTELSDIDVCAVSAGPGSFTGVRIGISAVKGICYKDDIPCIGVSSLEAMSYNYAMSETDALICSCMDARRSQVYTACFECDGGKMKRLSPDEAIGIDTLGENLKKYGKKVIFIGDGAHLCYNTLNNSSKMLYEAPQQLIYQNAVSVALCARALLENTKPVPPRELMPFYLRAPQAERELNKRRNS